MESATGGGAATELGNLAADGPAPFRRLEPDAPDAAFAQPTVTTSAYKEDYRRSTKAGEKVYALETNPAITITPDEYKRLRSRQDTISGTKSSPDSPKSGLFSTPKLELPWFQEKKFLSVREAETLQEPLSEAILSDFEYLDKAIWGYTHDPLQQQIWSDTDKDEANKIAKILIKRGQRSAAAAEIVRSVVDSQDYVDVLMIVVPRAIKTVKAVKAAPKRERPTRMQRVAQLREVKAAHEAQH